MWYFFIIFCDRITQRWLSVKSILLDDFLLFRRRDIEIPRIGMALPIDWLLHGLIIINLIKAHKIDAV